MSPWRTNKCLKRHYFVSFSPPFFQIDREICTLRVCLVIVRRKYYTYSCLWVMCAAFWNSDYRPAGKGVKSSDVKWVLFENCTNITGFFTCQEMLIIALYVMLERTTVAHSKENICHNWNRYTLVKAICHLHQQINLSVVTWCDYMHGQKIAQYRYYYASVWTENIICCLIMYHEFLWIFVRKWVRDRVSG